MRDFRRLPPLLRVAGILGLLLPLASLALLTPMFPTRLSTSDSPADFNRVEAIATSLGMLGLACTIVVATYTRGFRRSGTGPFPLASWQSQVRTFVILATLPLCVLAWAVVIPPTQPGFGTVFLLSALAGGVFFGFGLWRLARY